MPAILERVIWQVLILRREITESTLIIALIQTALSLLLRSKLEPMPNGNLSLWGTVQEFSIYIDQIKGTGGPDYPCLTVPIKFDFLPISDQHRTFGFEVPILRGELYATNTRFKCSEQIVIPHVIKVHEKVSTIIGFNFPLNDVALHKLEKHRQGNIVFHLTFTLQVGIFSSLPIQNAFNFRVPSFLNSFETIQGHISFEIEQSQWVKKILPELGYKSIKLIELPGASEVIPEEYSLSLIELDEARRYFTNGEYDKSVAHCRSAIEPFKRKLPELKNFLQSQSEFRWANEVMVATDEWLDKMIKATWSFTSKPHHVPSISHFGRTDAEILMMITTAIIAYIGKIQFKL
jgi:hypothetical protein